MSEIIRALTTTEVLQHLAETFNMFRGVYTISNNVSFLENLTPESANTVIPRYYSVKAIGPEKESREATDFIEAPLRIHGYHVTRRWNDFISIDLNEVN